jgi:peroxiredoxin Q/BCP
MEGKGTIVGKVAPDFTLPDHLGNLVSLGQMCVNGPVLIVFYPKDFTKVCTKQLCNYSDNMSGFQELGVQVVGISQNSASSHSLFAKRFSFPFKLLTDVNHSVTRDFDCSSLFMFGAMSRAVFIVSAKRVILYRYVEPTVLTHRSAKELLQILTDLRANKLI